MCAGGVGRHFDSRAMCAPECTAQHSPPPVCCLCRLVRASSLPALARHSVLPGRGWALCVLRALPRALATLGRPVPLRARLERELAASRARSPACSLLAWRAGRPYLCLSLSLCHENRKQKAHSPGVKSANWLRALSRQLGRRRSGAGRTGGPARTPAAGQLWRPESSFCASVRGALCGARPPPLDAGQRLSLIHI